MARASDRLLNQALDVAWQQWAQLGAASWARMRPANWAIEVEPLIAYTAFLVEHDARLLRESIDWCAAHTSLVSIQQLRNVVTTQRWPFAGEVAKYGATLARYSGLRWPAPHAEPYDVVLSGKSGLPSLHDRALIQLRLRAIFGVSARAEIIRVLSTRPASEWSATQVAERVAYTRRQVSNDLEMLTLGGMTYRSGSPGKFAYALADHAAVTSVIGDLPDHAPAWAPLFRVMTGLLDAVRDLERRPRQAPQAELARRFRLLEPAFVQLRLSPPEHVGSYLERGLTWISDLFVAVSSGDARQLHPLGIAT